MGWIARHGWLPPAQKSLRISGPVNTQGPMSLSKPRGALGAAVAYLGGSCAGGAGEALGAVKNSGRGHRHHGRGAWPPQVVWQPPRENAEGCMDALHWHASQVELEAVRHLRVEVPAPPAHSPPSGEPMGGALQHTQARGVHEGLNPALDSTRPWTHPRALATVVSPGTHVAYLVPPGQPRQREEGPPPGSPGIASVAHIPQQA